MCCVFLKFYLLEKWNSHEIKFVLNLSWKLYNKKTLFVWSKTNQVMQFLSKSLLFWTQQKDIWPILNYFKTDFVKLLLCQFVHLFVCAFCLFVCLTMWLFLLVPLSGFCIIANFNKKMRHQFVVRTFQSSIDNFM